MNVYEMEGFLRGKCLPGDLKVNESNAEYLVRKLNVASGLKGELTAALATIEKCREITNCPAGVDLQDHLRQLAAENVGLKGALTGSAYISFIKANGWNTSASTVNGKFVNFADPEVDFGSMVFAHAKKLIEAVETPATDRIYAGIKADGVEEFIGRLQQHLDEGDFIGDEVGLIAVAIHCGREMAQQLREGEKS